MAAAVVANRPAVAKTPVAADVAADAAAVASRCLASTSCREFAHVCAAVVAAVAVANRPVVAKTPAAVDVVVDVAADANPAAVARKTKRRITSN